MLDIHCHARKFHKDKARQNKHAAQLCEMSLSFRRLPLDPSACDSARTRLAMTTHDVIVIGGGSGGSAFAKRAAGSGTEGQDGIEVSKK